MSMTMVNNGHKVLAKSVFNEDFHLAWGQTPEGFDTTGWNSGEIPPTEDTKATSLLGEIGRRISTFKSYVTEDPNGTIVANNSTWSQSTEPTRHIYLQFKFEASDASDKVVRQVGLFQGSVKKDTVEVGKLFLQPSDLEDEGILFMYQNIEPVSRNASTREIYEYVITF